MLKGFRDQASTLCIQPTQGNNSCNNCGHSSIFAKIVYYYFYLKFRKKNVCFKITPFSAKAILIIILILIFPVTGQ